MLPGSFHRDYIPVKSRVQRLFFASCLFRFASVKSALTTLSAIQRKYPSADVAGIRREPDRRRDANTSCLGKWESQKPPEMPAGTSKEDTEQSALAAPKVQSYLEGRQIRKVTFVPKRLINIGCG